MKAIKIDVVNQKVEQVSIGNDLEDIYEQIANGCTTFTCVYGLDTADVIYADDEAILKDVQGGFMLHSMKYPIVGNGLVLGTNLEGESVSSEVSVDFLEKNIIWLEEIIKSFHTFEVTYITNNNGKIEFRKVEV